MNMLHAWRRAARAVSASAASAAFAAFAVFATSGAVHAAVVERDGAHDFDFNRGTWRTRIRRTPHPFASSDSYEMRGTVNVRPVWGGRAWLEEIEVDGARGPWQGLTLFLYDPRSRQWSQNFVNSASGVFSQGLVGSFAGGRGELYAPDVVDGRAVLVRGTWSDIDADGHRYREDYSDDGGTSWREAFSAELTRADPLAIAARQHDGAHDFDFDFGAWTTRSSRLVHPLANPPAPSNAWTELEGTTVVTPVWGGRANLAEYRADGPGGPLELLALRIWNPETRTWSLNFATPSVGRLGVPGVGAFKDGRGDFYDVEPVDGTSVLVRFSIWSLGPDAARSEQAFSVDGGKTWETNWINRYVRRAAG